MRLQTRRMPGSATAARAATDLRRHCWQQPGSCHLETPLPSPPPPTQVPPGLRPTPGAATAATAARAPAAPAATAARTVSGSLGGGAAELLRCWPLTACLIKPTDTTYTPLAGEEGPMGPHGERGEQGEQGIQGVQGIQVGSAADL